MRLLSDAPPDMARGDRLKLRVAVQLDALQPSDVHVEFIARQRHCHAQFQSRFYV